MPIITTAKQMRPRDEHDHYPTPRWLVEAALDLVGVNAPQRILDIGAGSGIWGEVAKENWPLAHPVGVEIQPAFIPNSKYDAWLIGDFLQLPYLGRPGWFDLVMGNPPYSIAEECVRKGHDLLIPGSEMVMLLRLAFLEGQARGEGLWRELPPKHVAVCSKRPSFTGNGKTDATAYAVYLWQKGWTGETKLTWIREAVG